VGDETANVPDVPVNVPINVPVNERQRWFLDEITNGIACGAAEVAAHFHVTEKTAKRDLADLKARQLIEFVGAPKNGFYRIKGLPLQGDHSFNIGSHDEVYR
jgi:predicted HTH transcriptional regulator